MAFDFPSSPTIGQKYIPSTGITYIWTGVAWDRVQPSKGGGVVVMPAGVIMAFAGVTPPPGAIWCDGSTFDPAVYPALYAVLGNSNVTPDLRGRVIIGIDRQVGGAYADRVTNTGIGNPGLNSRVMKATAGFDRFTIAAVNIPAHTHTGSGTSSTVSSDHAHSFNVNTGGENVDHAHYVSVMTSAVGNHSHDYRRTNYNSQSALGTNSIGNTYTDGVNTSAAGGHDHSVNVWSGGRNTGHIHNVAGGTGGISANHTHTYSFTSSSYGGGEAMPILQPSIVLGFVIFTGEVI